MGDKVTGWDKRRGAAARLVLFCAFALMAACARDPGTDPGLFFDPAPVSAVDPGPAPVGEPQLAPPPVAKPTPRGPFAFLRRNRTPAPAPVLTAPDAPPPPEYLVADLPPQPEPVANPQPSTRPRPFGFLFKRVPGEVTAPTPQRVAIAEPAAEPVPEDVALGGPTEAVDTPITVAAEPPRRGGWLFGRNRRNAVSNAAANPTFTGPLPFGQVASACGTPKRDMGVEVARSPGSGQFRLYDTNPTSIAPRTQYVTGFRDGCPRRFTASLALFGTAAVHEATRYNPLNESSYSRTDEVYESVKRRVCGVRRGAFCPEGRLDRLEREAAFVSVYRSFGGTGEWMEMFLHKGELAAHAVITR